LGYSHISTIPLIGSLAVEYFELQNGLKIAIVNDPTTPIFSYQTWFTVGAADEQPGKQGLAHLFEHMMFRKTKQRDMGMWEKEVNANGGTGINAYTSRDQTVYYFTFPNDKIDIAAHLESERMVELVIESDMFETEKGAVLTERNRGLDNPGRYLWEELYKLVYTSHPYRYSIIGEEKSIKGFTVHEAQQFYQSYYSPNNALVIVVGDVDIEAVLTSIDSHYSHIPSLPRINRPFIDERALSIERKLSLSHPKATQHMMAKAWITGNIVSEDYTVLWLIGKLLAGQKSALLQQKLVNSAKARNVHADIFVGKDNGTFEFYAEVSDSEKFSTIDDIVLESLLELASGKISEEQLQIVKNGMEKEYYSNITTPSMLARMLGEGYIYANDLRLQITLMDKIKKISPEEIKSVTQRYLVDAKSASLYLAPET
jgi:zinc protease